MSSGVNEFILRKKRKKLLKRVGIISIFVLSILVFILIKAPTFNITQVEIKDNYIISSDNIVNKKNIVNNNIFLTNLNDVKSEVLNNPYIKDVKIERKIPNKIVISVEERTATFGVVDENKSYVLNEELVIMEERDSLEGINVPIIKGLQVENRYLGEPISLDNRKSNCLKQLAEVCNNKTVKVDIIDIVDINNIYIQSGDVKIILGKDEDIIKKTEKAFNILSDNELKITKGYIDVSFKGNPVIYDEELE